MEREARNEMVWECLTCDRTRLNFRLNLLGGCYPGVMEAYSTGCVNLRSSCNPFHPFKVEARSWGCCEGRAYFALFFFGECLQRGRWI